MEVRKVQALVHQSRPTDGRDEDSPGHVGSIPLDWTWTTLVDLLREPVRNGVSPICPDQVTGDWTLSLSAVSESGYDPNGAKPAPLNDERLKQFRLNAGDLVVSRSNTPERVGLAGIYNGIPSPCSYPDLLMRVRLARSFNPELLLAQLLSNRGRTFFSSEARGSSGSMVKIDRAILESFPVAVPTSVEEQRAIAEALSDADALIESLSLLLAKKRQIKQGAMQELLTGKKRLPGFSGKWKTFPLGDIAHIKTGKRNNQDKVEDGPFPFFVRSAEVERIDSYSYDCEAILVPGEGGIGSIFHYIDGRFDVHQRVYAITQFAPGAFGKYVHLYMSRYFGPYAMQNSVKATVDSLRLPTFHGFAVRLPPTTREQAAIANVVGELEEQIAAMELRLTKARDIKQGMMQALLTGHIRLVQPA